MNAKLLLALAALAASLALVPTVAADPPGTCLFGYNPNAVTNVCYGTGPTVTVPTPAVGSGTLTVCPIGDICAPPIQNVPTVDPTGGPGLPVTLPFPTDVEVLGQNVLGAVEGCRNVPALVYVLCISQTGEVTLCDPYFSPCQFDSNDLP